MTEMAQDLFSVRNKVVAVTGGLGQLGREYSVALAQRGACVAVLDLNLPPESTIAERYPASPGEIIFLEADVTSRPSLETALARLTEKWGAPHVLINNAALDSPPDSPAEVNGPFETYPEAIWDKVVDVNLKGVFLCCQVFGGAMAKEGRGSIINIGSIYGLLSPNHSIYDYRLERDGLPFFKPVAYSASKSGVMNLTRYLATYWAGKGVRVNTLSLAGVFNNQDKQFLEGYLARMPMGRMANPDEYNGAIIFLASDASSYMTGSNLVIDGGWTAW